MPNPPTFWLVDKPTGRSSFSVVAAVRKLSGVQRVGHAGTLDPLATGLLIVLVGRGQTKQQDGFLHLDKKYTCTVQFGLITDSYDSTGLLLSTAPWSQLKKITRAEMENKLITFRGEILQQVPAFSAIKHHGKKLYQFARAGKAEGLDLPIRAVTIFAFELTDFQLDEKNQQLFASFAIHCSSGTYIRSLIHDLGQKLGVGAVVTGLRRIQIGEYLVDNALSVSQLEEFYAQNKQVTH